MSKEDKRGRDFFTNHHSCRIVGNVAAKIITALYIAWPTNWNYLKDTETRNYLLKYRHRVGMLEGAIFGNPIFIPTDDGVDFELRNSPAGTWSAYDFTRHDLLGNDVINRVVAGKLSYYDMEPYVSNPKSRKTPIGVVDPFDVVSIFAESPGRLGEILDKELAELTTTEEAYKRVGRYEHFAEEMHG